jgi:hypothetical protein
MMTTRDHLEKIWRQPGVRAPGHVAGLLPAWDAARKDALVRRVPGFDPDEGVAAARDALIEGPDRLVTVKGRELKGKPCPCIEWSDPPLDQPKAKRRRKRGA